MDEWILLGILLGGVYLLVLPILTIIAWSRSGRHSELIEQLQDALRETRRQLTALHAAAPVMPPAPAAKPDIAPAPEPEAIPALLEPTPSESTRTISESLPEDPPPEPLFSHAQPEDNTAEPLPPPIVKMPARSRSPAHRTQGTPSSANIATGPNLLQRAFAAAKDWLLGGNTIVRVGMLLVFLGLAFLLRYASEHVVVPLELRYLSVAASALAGLFLGWRLRHKRPAYALLMQGGAVAALYLTTFSALKLHDQPLLSTQMGFALLVAVVILSGVLAVAQDALALAVAGALGGFATPVLLSTGGGSHVALFSYFALLNTGILGIAWFKAWRPLNLIGFFGTFLIGLAWGLRSYDPAQHFASAEAFLILFFLMFVAIGLLFARRMLLNEPDTPSGRDSAEWAAWLAKTGHAAQRYVDGTILFGTPIVAFSLQVGLIQHIDYGSAFSALVLGVFYLILARLAHGTNPLRYRLLTEIFLALGVIFASLAIPLGLDAQWTCAAWAMEAAGIYWIGQRQQRPWARAFALLLQAGALAAFVSQLSPGENSLLAGSSLGALMLGLSFLCNVWVLRQQTAERRSTQWDGRLSPLFLSLGLWSLYLMAPLLWQAEYAAIACSLAGLLSLLAGLRLKLRGALSNALLVQVAAGLLFLTRLDQADTGGVLVLAGSGWRGLFIAGLIGLASLASLGTAIREARRANDPALVQRLAWAMLFGLGFIALAVLFVLPWQTATAVWAACGFVLMWAAMRLKLKPAFWFALVLEVFAGLAFLHANSLGLYLLGHLPLGPDARAFAHAGFWTPIIIALAAFAAAWRLHAWARSPAASEEDALSIDAEWIAFPALLWSAAWWSFGWWQELRGQATSDVLLGHSFLAVIAASVLLLLPIAAKWRWARLAGLCAGLLPLLALCAAFDYSANAHLLAHYGWLAFGLALVASVSLLHISHGVLFDASAQRVHSLAAWVWLGVTALESRYLFLSLSEPGSSWRWLGWVLPLAAWLLWSARRTAATRWPARLYPALYRFSITLPVLCVLLIWLGLANLQSPGNAAPLPFIPLLNPLDLALVLTLFASWQWLAQVREQSPATLPWQPLHTPLTLVVLAGAFLTYTCSVLRGVHHLASVPWREYSLQHSMIVQASLSIAWALLALGLMISGYRRAGRKVWICGAVLAGVVVAKLFFIELANSGGLERIISFISVGILLLIVGYFAPLPPAKDETP